MSDLDFFKNQSDAIGFRLNYMELLNWGTFHEKIWTIRPEGFNSLLTGSIGSGKSTVVDALTTLIVPSQKIIYNKAAGAESRERNLISYIKGNYSTKTDDYNLKGKAVSLRYKDSTDITPTVLLANFLNPAYNETITLVQVFVIHDDKVKKLFLIGRNKPLTIKEYFINFEDITELRKKLKKHNFIEIFDDSFTKYSQRFLELFSMNSSKAIDLFYQTISMKSVTSLNDFVKDQMLEKTNIHESIENLKVRFEDLNRAHESVLNARRQKEVLEPLVNLHNEYNSLNNEIKEIDGLISTLPSYYATFRVQLLDVAIKRDESKHLQLNQHIQEIKAKLPEKQDQQNQLKIDIDKNGGQRLKEIENEIRKAESQRDAKQQKFTKYNQLIVNSKLNEVQTEKDFYEIHISLDKKLSDIDIQLDTINNELGLVTGKISNLEQEIKLEEQELASLKSRKNQIPSELLHIRTKLANELGLNEQELPFVGELLKVKDSEKEWEGAIERLLKNFGLSMLVSEKDSNMVISYINQTTLKDSAKNRGLRLEYFKVPIRFINRNTEPLSTNSILDKIEIKFDSLFEDWIESELKKRFNLKCVEIDEFKTKRDVITKQGQYKFGEFRYIKDDRVDLLDRRNYILGWTNLEKIQAIEKHLSKLYKEKEILDNKTNELRNLRIQRTQLRNSLNSLKDYDNWTELNFQEEILKIQNLKQEKSEIENSNDILKELERQLSIVKSDIESLEKERDHKNREMGGLERDIQKNKIQKTDSLLAIDMITQIERDIFFPKINSFVVSSHLTLDNINDEQSKLDKNLKNKKESIWKKVQSLRDKIINYMRDYRQNFPNESSELAIDIHSAQDYINKHTEIVRDDLPKYEERFKEELKENTINDIAGFDNRLNEYEKEIKKKIKEINKHLIEIDYNYNTYIELKTETNHEIDIKIFKEDLKKCYHNAMSIEDIYTEDRFIQVKKILDRFKSNETKEINWTEKVTDVRNWFTFSASENNRDDHSQKEFYSGSSGKSGGQKEKLAYTILAAALAYQYGLSYDESNSKSFRFAVIDEAFGRGDDESTQFGLELFKKLKLQLLIVTPLQKIHVIENYINSVHLVSINKIKSQSEIEYMTVEEYKEKKVTTQSMTS